MFVDIVDMVATLGETTGFLALMNMHKKMQADAVGQEILQWVKMVS